MQLDRVPNWRSAAASPSASASARLSRSPSRGPHLIGVSHVRVDHLWICQSRTNPFSQRVKKADEAPAWRCRQHRPTRISEQRTFSCTLCVPCRSLPAARHVLPNKAALSIKTSGTSLETEDRRGRDRDRLVGPQWHLDRRLSIRPAGAWGRGISHIGFVAARWSTQSPAPPRRREPEPAGTQQPPDRTAMGLSPRGLRRPQAPAGGSIVMRGRCAFLEFLSLYWNVKRIHPYYPSRLVPAPCTDSSVHGVHMVIHRKNLP
jgi:hypothetical protein